MNDHTELPTCAWQSIEDGIPCGDEATHQIKGGGATYCREHAERLGLEFVEQINVSGGADEHLP